MFATGRILAFGALLSTLSGCAALDVTAWFGGDAKDTLNAPARQQQASAVPGAPSGWIVDKISGCATSNPQPTAGESIRWFGDCGDGKLTGQGTLIWYNGGREVERNEGGFRGGELHGEMVTTFDDSSYIVGKYVDGRRDGNFIIRRPDGSYLHTIYEDGALSARRVPSTGEIDAWLLSRANRVAYAAEAPAANNMAKAPADASVRQLAEASPGTAPKTNAAKMAPSPAQHAAPRAPMPSAPVPQKMMQQIVPAVASTTGSGSAPWSSGAATGYGGTIVVSSTSVTYEPAYSHSATPPARNPQRPAPVVAYQPAALYPGTANPLGGVIQSAIMYAGRDGPWVVDGRGASAAPASGGTIVVSSASVSNQNTNQNGAVRRASYTPPRVVVSAYQPAAQLPRKISGFDSANSALLRPSGATPPAMPARPVVAATQRAQATPTPPKASPDTLFSRGYQLELAGRRQAAARLYDELLLRYPSAPSALLANARIVQLRQPRRQQGQHGQTEQPVRDPLVVTVNARSPGGPLRPASLTPSQTSRSPALHRQVCSRNGLYESNSGWCGTVTGEQGPYYWVRVDDVHLRGFATIGITRSACTGNYFLTWFSLGASVKVPKQCMTFHLG